MVVDGDKKTRMEKLLDQIRLLELEQIRHCDSKQREVINFRSRGRSCTARLNYLKEWGTGRENRERMEQGRVIRSLQFVAARDLQFKLGTDIQELKRMTIIRKALRILLGLPPTADEYLDLGESATLGTRFVILDYEIDSTTSIRHYMDEHMAGSSLFAHESSMGATAAREN